MSTSIAVLEWAAYAQSLNTEDAWIRWGQQATPSLDALELAPPLTSMNPMLRRRVSLTGRLACEVAYGATQSCRELGQWSTDTAMVFATRYGDAQKSLAMLADLTAGNPLSPTHFGLAVHNAAGAFFAMAQGYKNNMTVITAGEQTIRCAFTESLGLLADGAPEVLLVSYDLPLPTPYENFHTSTMPGHAWALRMRQAQAGDANALQIGFRDLPAAPARLAQEAGAALPANPSVLVLQQWLDGLNAAAAPRTLWV